MLFELTICLLALSPIMVSPIIISYNNTKKAKRINFINQYNNQLPECLRV